MKNILIIAVCLVVGASVLAAEKKDPISGKLICENSGDQISVSLEATNSKGKIIIPVRSNEPKTFFKRGSRSGCEVITKLSKMTRSDLSPKQIKGLGSVVVFNILVPAFEGMEFELGFDVLVFRNADSSLMDGPVLSAGGLENSVQNVFETVSENEVRYTHESSGEGQTTKSRLTYIKESGTWREKP